MASRFSLSKARRFQQNRSQKVLGYRGISWVPMKDYDRLDRWFAEALDHIEYLKPRKKNQNSQRGNPPEAD